jgi:hypothetical protein
MKLGEGMKTVAVLLGWALSLAAFQTAPAAREAKGSIEGRVVNAVSGDAVRKVNLTLTANHRKGEPVTAQTDDNGRFAFHDVAAGQYRLNGGKTGFADQEYGARLNPNSGALLKVSAGEAVKDVAFKLVPNAVIGGRVVDQDGEPMPNLMVAALRNGYMRGKRQWMQADGAQTNDRGEFRIGNLRAGRYIVRAADMNIGIGLAGVGKDAIPDKPETSYAATYSGNTAEMERAAPIEVRMGEDRRGADIQMLKSTTVRVRGKVVGAPDGKVLMVMLRLKNAGGARLFGPGGIGLVQPADATFEIKGVAPGSYLLMVRSATEMMSSLGAPMPLEVADRHIDGVVLALTKGGGELSGKLTIPGAFDAKNMTVGLERVDFQGMGSPSAKVAEDGKFLLKDVFTDRYTVRVSGLPENSYMKSVKLGSQEMDPSGADLSGGAAGLEILVSRSGAQVEGTVMGQDDKPMSGATVTLIPESGRESSYRSMSADADGTFTMKALPPGKYKILAWEDVEPGAYQDAEYVKPFEGMSRALVLEENGKAKVTLKAVPFEKVSGKP